MVALPSLGSYEAVEHGLGPSHHSERREESLSTNAREGSYAKVSHSEPD
jgi:hypothetical protein